jgi:HSP20 family protein
MSDEDDYDDDEDDIDDPLDIFKYFKDPNGIFKNFDPSKIFESKEFNDIFKQIFDQVYKNLPEEFQNMSPEEFLKEFTKNKSKFGVKGPFTYGFRFDFGKDGKPIVEPFGNIKKEKYTGKPEVKNDQEPLIEVSEVGDNIILIAEMPGVTKEDIELKATNQSLTISTKKDAARAYYKDINLPSAINSDYAKARYTNGILEVQLKKLDQKQTKIKID